MNYPLTFLVLASPIITLASAVLAYNHPIKRMDIYNYTTDATTENDTESGDSASIWANFNGFNRIRGTVSAAFGLELSTPPSYVTSSTIGVTVATMEWQLEKLKSKWHCFKWPFYVRFWSKFIDSLNPFDWHQVYWHILCFYLFTCTMTNKCLIHIWYCYNYRNQILHFMRYDISIQICSFNFHLLIITCTWYLVFYCLSCLYFQTVNLLKKGETPAHVVRFRQTIQDASYKNVR